jgi:hypothetical protein
MKVPGLFIGNLKGNLKTLEICKMVFLRCRFRLKRRTPGIEQCAAFIRPKFSVLSAIRPRALDNASKCFNPCIKDSGRWVTWGIDAAALNVESTCMVLIVTTVFSSPSDLPPNLRDIVQHYAMVSNDQSNNRNYYNSS